MRSSQQVVYFTCRAGKFEGLWGGFDRFSDKNDLNPFDPYATQSASNSGASMTQNPIMKASAKTGEIFGFKCVILSDKGAKNLLRSAQKRGQVTLHGDSSASPQNDISEKVS
ncbi:MAG: hypothetical protein BroJett011_32270 [Chloroflexota bacterium]|nr:MAG: hypothetical protein BroJett011_32270 [Chloroflexota bacterium]